MNLKRYYKLIATLSCTASLAACGFDLANIEKFGTMKESLDHKTSSIFTPNAPFIRNLPQGDDSYSTGFRDGCTTHMGIMGAGSLRMLPSKLDGFKLSQDTLYFQGFNAGANYCTHLLDWEVH